MREQHQLEAWEKYCSRIGELAYIGDEKFSTLVKIKDIKFSYGVIYYQVTPVLGKGSKWVDYDAPKPIEVC